MHSAPNSQTLCLILRGKLPKIQGRTSSTKGIVTSAQYLKSTGMLLPNGSRIKELKMNNIMTHVLVMQKNGQNPNPSEWFTAAYPYSVSSAWIKRYVHNVHERCFLPYAVSVLAEEMVTLHGIITQLFISTNTNAGRHPIALLFKILSCLGTKHSSGFFFSLLTFHINVFWEQNWWLSKTVGRNPKHWILPGITNFVDVNEKCHSVIIWNI